MMQHRHVMCGVVARAMATETVRGARGFVACLLAFDCSFGVVSVVWSVLFVSQVCARMRWPVPVSLLVCHSQCGTVMTRRACDVES